MNVVQINKIFMLAAFIEVVIVAMPLSDTDVRSAGDNSAPPSIGAHQQQNTLLYIAFSAAGSADIRRPFLISWPYGIDGS